MTPPISRASVLAHRNGETHFPPFSGLVALPNFARSFMWTDQAPEEPRRPALNDVKWDKAVVPEFRPECQVLA